MQLTHILFLFTSIQSQCTPWHVDFTTGASNQFTYAGPYKFDGAGLQMQIQQGNTANTDTGILMGYGTLASSVNLAGYGQLTIAMTSGQVGGIVTAVSIISDDKDEIDWEFVGSSTSSVQSNFYSLGVLNYTNGQTHSIGGNTHTDQHSYAIKWSSDSIQWLIDGGVVRTLDRINTTMVNGQYAYPSQPGKVFLSLWDGGSGAQGTKDWAGGQVNWNDPSIVANGGVMTAEVTSVDYAC